MKDQKAQTYHTHPLGQVIIDQLSRHISNDYIFLDLPYYTNIGDTLIWKGTEDFLAQTNANCLYKASIETYIKPDIANDVIILFQGGGNFGDIWRRHTEHVIQVLNDFPDNPAIILPQTVHYNSSEILKSDAQIISAHKNLTICTRDTNSYELVNNNFKVKDVLLLPDMAFCINNSLFNKHSKASTKASLFFKRKDVEIAEYDFHKYITEPNPEQKEWPSMDKQLPAATALILLSILRKRLPNADILKCITDWYAINLLMPYLLKIGIRFISSYKKVYSTRLHGAILAILLKKQVVFFDNSYGKNSSFYYSWLKESDNVKFIDKEA